MSEEFILPQGTVILSTSDLEGNIVRYNSGFRDASGYTDIELKGKPHNLLRHPDMPKEAFQDLWQTLQAGRAWFGIVKNTRKDGKHYWVSANAAPIRDGDEITGYVSVRYPATREQVAFAEQLYADIRSGRTKMPWTKVQKNHHILPLTIAAISGLVPLISLGLEATSSVTLLSSALLSTTGISYLLYKVMTANKLSPAIKKGINDIANQRLQSPIEDFTETGFIFNYLRARVAEHMAKDYDALRDAQIMMTAMDSASTNLMITDIYFNIISINNNLKEMLTRKEAKIQEILPHFSADQVVGNNMDMFHKHPERQRKILENIIEPLQAEIKMADMVLQLTVTPIVKEGLKIGYVVEWLDRTIEATVVTELAQVFDGMMRGDFSRHIEADADGIYLQIKQDVNDSVDVIKKLFEQLESAMQELSTAKVLAEQASSAKSQFIHNMTHELRTPLNAITGFVQLLCMDQNLTPHQITALDHVMSASKHLLDIINQVLDMSQIESGKLEMEHISLDVNELFDTSLEMVSTALTEKHLTLIKHIDPELPSHIQGDPIRIRQVLINLLSNAIKFTPEGSITLTATKQDHKMVIEIIDTGIGISEETQHKLFRMFSQADEGVSRQHGGIGLGLVLSKGLIEQMRGTLHLTSKLGKGTKVTIKLPITSIHDTSETGKVSSASVERNNQTHTQLKDKRVLLVEDNKINQIVAFKILERIGIKPDIANHGQEAMDMRALKKYDLILLDVQMPVKDGYATISEIREEEQTTGEHQLVVGLSANGLKQDLEKAKFLGMDDYITKPIDLKALEAKIDYWLLGIGEIEPFS